MSKRGRIYLAVFGTVALLLFMVLRHDPAFDPPRAHKCDELTQTYAITNDVGELQRTHASLAALYCPPVAHRTLKASN